METTGQSSLFELALDQEAIGHLHETARWGKFLGIAGFVMCGLIVIMAFAFGAIMAASTAMFQPVAGNDAVTAALAPILSIAFGAMYMVLAVVYFFPCLFLYRFSVRMKTALKTHDQVKLNQSLKAQRFLFRYVGILTIIGLAFFAIEVLALGVVALLATFSHGK